MKIDAKFDSDASRTAQKLIFSCEHFELHREDIIQLKGKKLINYVQEDQLPQTIPCQVLVFVEKIKARVILFNPSIILSLKDEPFLNKDIIERTKEN